jgi:hypothetical protein
MWRAISRVSLLLDSPVSLFLTFLLIPVITCMLPDMPHTISIYDIAPYRLCKTISTPVHALL